MAWSTLDEKPFSIGYWRKEQTKALNGEVAPPPKKPREPRAAVPIEREASAERPSCAEHLWSLPASDGIRNCHNCSAEKET